MPPRSIGAAYGLLGAEDLNEPSRRRFKPFNDERPAAGLPRGVRVSCAAALVPGVGSVSAGRGRGGGRPSRSLS